VLIAVGNNALDVAHARVAHMSKCPFDSKCLSTSIVYKAEISTSDDEETKEYIGMTAGTYVQEEV
jgi:hypothetical protein